MKKIFQYWFWLSLSGAILFIGVVQLNVFDMHRWYTASKDNVEQMMSTDEGVYIPDENATKIIQEFFADLIASQKLQKPMLVSFNLNGLVLIQDQSVRMLTKPEDDVLQALLYVLPDESILYVLNYPNRQTLIRAALKNTVLQTLWEKDHTTSYLHHWGDVFQGTLYIPGRRFGNLPNTHSRRMGHSFGTCTTQNALLDQIHLINIEDGTLLEKIDLLPLIATMQDGEELWKRISSCKNPLHLNSIQVVKTDAIAELFPNGKIGDMLISFRDTHAVLLLDANTRAPKWHVLGGDENKKFFVQHSPKFTNRDTMLIFDNMGSDEENGYSRIVELAIPSGDVVGSYEASGDNFFSSELAGTLDFVDGTIYVQDHRGSDNNPDDDIAFFQLDCPTTYVSNDCVPTDLFRGDESRYSFNNAVILGGN